MDTESNDDYSRLPSHLQRRIDRAFFSTIRKQKPNRRSPRKKRKLDSDTNAGGGFIIEDTGGGFIVEDDAPNSAESGGFIAFSDEKDSGSESAHISLAAIPSALESLNLPPDDAQILSVFRKAASDWDGEGEGSEGDMGVVSLDDWRAVCAVLFENHSGSGPEEEEDDEQDSDAYVSEEQDIEEDQDSDEYMEDSAVIRRRPRRTNNAELDSDEETFIPKSLTPRQRQTCLETFALFFDTVPQEELPKQKIMIADLQRVTKLLNEKIKAEDMLAMIEAFSTSPDKSMSLSDFEKMMIAAGLV
ncbi:hypothetical protein VNI00_017155 [Paramarasmius palmivorus]|uniref:Uncharacterized protein n=1 Tax=Paramarasmius palmivorus TaxID=297713 RepID=A0AAW0B729_9AGAR